MENIFAPWGKTRDLEFSSTLKIPICLERVGGVHIVCPSNPYQWLHWWTTNQQLKNFLNFFFLTFLELDL